MERDQSTAKHFVARLRQSDPLSSTAERGVVLPLRYEILCPGEELVRNATRPGEYPQSGSFLHHEPVFQREVLLRRRVKTARGSAIIPGALKRLFQRKSANNPLSVFTDTNATVVVTSSRKQA